MAMLINGFLNRKLLASDRLVSFISFLLLSVSENLSLITQTNDQVSDGCRRMFALAICIFFFFFFFFFFSFFVLVDLPSKINLSEQ